MKLSVFDIDGTLSKGFFIVEFPKWLCANKPGAFDPIENQNIQEFYMKFSTGGLIHGKPYEYEQFAWDLVLAFGKGIKDLAKAKLMEMGREYVASNPVGFSFAKGLVELVKEKGYIPIAVSGSPYEIILAFAESVGIGINEVFATTYKNNNGVFTGDYERNCAIDTEKKKITDDYFKTHIVDGSASAGFGDSLHDLSFLNSVGFAVAVAMEPKNDTTKQNKLKKYAQNDLNQKVKRWLILDDEDQVVDKVGLYLP